VAIYDPHKFADFSDDKKVSVMRATAGLKSYMSEPVVTYSWEMQSECVRALWGEWKEDYETVRVYFPSPALLLTRTTFDQLLMLKYRMTMSQTPPSKWTSSIVMIAGFRKKLNNTIVDCMSECGT
jgi:hypothetical protein